MHSMKSSLTLLSLERNEFFPVSVIFLLSRNLETLLLSGNNYTTLNPFPFQQLGMLIHSYLTDNPSKLQWLSYATNYSCNTKCELCDLQDIQQLCSLLNEDHATLIKSVKLISEDVIRLLFKLSLSKFASLSKTRAGKFWI